MELYDPAAPQRGLLALLQHALWQTLWVDSGPPSGAKLRLPAGFQTCRLVGAQLLPLQLHFVTLNLTTMLGLNLLNRL